MRESARQKADEIQSRVRRSKKKKAVKETRRIGGRMDEFAGKRGGERETPPLNHHWKVIRKLAGPRSDGRTDCPPLSTIPVMKWKRGGSVARQISLPYFLHCPKSSPLNMCTGCKK